MEKIRIGISRCLLGDNVRYDGGHQLDRYITGTLGQYFEWVSVCPEVEYGLPIPREALRLVGDPGAPRLVTIRTGVDHTEGMLKWAEARLKELEGKGLCGFIFKGKSPSSGIAGVKVYSPSGMPSFRGVGIFGGAFMRRFPTVPVIDDGRLHDPGLRENFIERVFVYFRWRDFLNKGGSLKEFISFHTDHKLLLLCHSPKHVTLLGRLVAKAKTVNREELYGQYVQSLMEGLSLLATSKKNTNTLLHTIGYFKKELSAEDKKEFLDVLENYHRGYLPLVVPIVLINHYNRKFNDPYLSRQHYLNPHPMELMLRNHV